MKQLHIVCLDVPYPPNYGGAGEMFHKIRALQAAGVLIHLHVFEYGRGAQPILKSLCASVHYYRRMEGHKGLSMKLPYIVTSRKSQPLLNRLSKGHQPILFEGIHTTGFAPLLKDRKLFLRSHNIEHQYYGELASQSTGIKSLLFRRESLCLRDYEPVTAGSMEVVFAISPNDQMWFADRGAKSVFLPPFHGSHHVDIQPGRGQYLLYQGDLSLDQSKSLI